MAKTKNFSFSDFMSFSESLVDSLEAVSNKIEEVTNQIETLESVLEGDESKDVSAEENVAVEDNVAAPEVPEDAAPNADEKPVAEDAPVADESITDEEVTEDSVADEAPAEDAPVADDVTAEAENDSAAIDAMESGDENFSNKFMVVGLKNRPWGNRVIKAKDFSEKEHNKLIPTLFSSQAQAQRALTTYNVTGGANFSIKYNHVNQMLGCNNTANKPAESKIVNASESRYEKVKSIFNM